MDRLRELRDVKMKRLFAAALAALLVWTAAGCEGSTPATMAPTDNEREFWANVPLPIEDRDPPRLEDTPNSTCFSAVGYIDKENLLYVQFRNSGSIYAYEGVSAETYQELLDAPSMGGYYNEYIKGVYVCHRLG